MLDKALEYFQENGVICKKVEDDREDYGDFIVIFGYGNLTREQIAERIKADNLLCMFFEGAIGENERKKRASGC